MRKIKKTPKPQVLIDHAKEWTTEYCACLNAGNKPSDTVEGYESQISRMKTPQPCFRL